MEKCWKASKKAWKTSDRDYLKKFQESLAAWKQKKKKCGVDQGFCTAL